MTAARARSLRSRTLVPAFVVGGALVAVALASVQVLSTRHLAGRLLVRSRMIGHMVEEVVASTPRPADVRRLVLALGRESEIDLIVVTAGQPPRVLASTRGEWLDRPLAAIGQPALVAQVARTSASRAESVVPLRGGEAVSFCTPVGSGPDSADPAVTVLIHFNGRAIAAQVNAWVRSVAILLLVLLAAAFVAAEVVLRYYVLAPIGAITAAARRRKEGDRDAEAPVLAGDELGRLAAAINEANHASDEATRQLEYQVFALDQAAVVSVTDPAGRILYVNDRFCELSGYSRPELVGRTHRVVSSDHHPPEFFTGMWATISAGKVWHGEVCNRAKDGSRYWVSSTIIPSLDAAGRIERFTGAYHDITDRVREEQAARDSEVRTRLVVDSALDAVINMDDAGLITAWNAQAERTFGWTAREAIGRKLSETIVPEAFRRAHERGLERFRQTREGAVLGQRIEITALRRTGEEFPVELAITPLPSANGHFFSAFVRDISERKRAEAELVQAKEAAQQANRAKSDFLATMSHEIRTPMNGVIGFTDLLLDSPLDPAQREYAETIRHSGHALLALINDILDFSKIEAGRLDVEHEPFDARQAAAEVVELLAAKARDGRLELVFDWHPDAPSRLVGDAMRFRQVLLNLLGNAIKFTEAGVVAIRAQRTDDGRLRVAVEDTGIGIPDDKLIKLFRKFTQADSSTTRRFGGTGLGLAICKQLVELLGGQIGAESRPGAGSTFWFTLPAPAAAEPAPAPAPDLAVAVGMRVLVVDDVEINRRALVAQLEAWGMIAAAAADGEAALALLRNAVRAGNPFDAALLDLNMPGMDGEALARAIRDEHAPGGPGLILMSSGSFRSEREHYRALGFSEVLLKPLVHPDHLLRPLAAIAGLRRGRGTVAGAPAGASAGPAPMPTTPSGLLARPMFDGARVLVAEDQPVNQKLAVKVLARAGCQVDVAGNGLEACELAMLRDYDLVLMDCHMPIRDGYEATLAIRAWEAAAIAEGRPGRHLPIVALTASVQKADRERCFASGMDDFISKPFRPEQIHAALQRWVTRDRDSEGPLREAA